MDLKRRHVSLRITIRDQSFHKREAIGKMSRIDDRKLRCKDCNSRAMRRACAAA
jgi:hypothetical protein